MVIYLEPAIFCLMQKGRRFSPGDDSNNNDSIGNQVPSGPPMWAVLLHDGPVILERAHQLFDGMHQTTNPRKRLKLDTLPVSVLDGEIINPHVHHSMERAQMIVLAVKASPGLSFAAIRHLENYLNARNGGKRALIAFLEGRSPSARAAGHAYDQLQKIASRNGVDFLAHIADPAPYAAQPYIASDRTPETAVFFE